MQRGYITLISVLILGALALAATIALLALGTDASRTAFAVQQSAQARALADACAEEALQYVHDSNTYTGTQTLTLGAGSCTYTVASQGGGNRTIDSSGTVDTIVRKVAVVVTAVSPLVVVSTWQEVADF